jgi:hypothetical protein
MTTKNRTTAGENSKSLVQLNTPKQSVKVLYQNLGGTWYAFADINDEIFFSPVSFKQSAPQNVETKASTHKKDSDKAA